MTGGGPAMTPPSLALFACPPHSSEDDRQPVVKSSEQPQTISKKLFIFNAWKRLLASFSCGMRP